MKFEISSRGEKGTGRAHWRLRATAAEEAEREAEETSSEEEGETQGSQRVITIWKLEAKCWKTKDRAAARGSGGLEDHREM